MLNEEAKGLTAQRSGPLSSDPAAEPCRLIHGMTWQSEWLQFKVQPDVDSEEQGSQAGTRDPESGAPVPLRVKQEGVIHARQSHGCELVLLHDDRQSEGRHEPVEDGEWLLRQSLRLSF